MVTVRELYSEVLPTLPACSVSLSAEDAEVALSFLASQSKASRRPWALPGRQPFAPSGDPVPCSKQSLDAKYEAVKEARERTCDHLKLALQRRASSRQSSGRSTSIGPSRAGSSFTDYGSRRYSPATPLGGASDFCSASSGSRSARGATPLPPRVLPGSPDYVAAVFPFPEPIPHEAPPRRPPARTPLSPATASASDAASPPAALSPPAGAPDCWLRKVSSDVHSVSSVAGAESTKGDTSARCPYFCKKAECHDEEFLRQNKERANEWISQCTPRVWRLERDRPYFVRAKLEDERRRKRFEMMYNNMPTMPFRDWCDMKRQEEAQAAIWRAEAQERYERKWRESVDA